MTTPTRICVHWTFEVGAVGFSTRQIQVLAPSQQAAQLKCLEQLDDGEAIAAPAARSAHPISRDPAAPDLPPAARHTADVLRIIERWCPPGEEVVLAVDEPPC
jgi:hypothetical protein